MSSQREKERRAWSTGGDVKPEREGKKSMVYEGDGGNREVMNKGE
jgi:hypothetical protein